MTLFNCIIQSVIGEVFRIWSLIMAYTDLKLEQDGTVLKITVDRPEVLNAQSRIMREELDDAIDKAADD